MDETRHPVPTTSPEDVFRAELEGALAMYEADYGTALWPKEEAGSMPRDKLETLVEQGYLASMPSEATMAVLRR